MNQIAQTNMIKQQLKTWNISKPEILNAFTNLSRTLFVPIKYQNFAYADIALPITPTRSLLPPKEEARMLQALQLKSKVTALEIGSGHGFITAILSTMFKQVITVDPDTEITKTIKTNLETHYQNITFLSGDPSDGWEHGGPFDLIWINGSLPFITENMVKNLTPNAQIIAVIGSSNPMSATSYQRSGSEWVSEKLFETYTPPLPGTKNKNAFNFDE
ncbi:MAG TPA: protein-L-isoaspartate O-methyltransferase [Gammaproteobacteria bacterium]|nr:protein-L-isoaspartate O-methyltransferase [Gammaproteobacteria bacterium]